VTASPGSCSTWRVVPVSHPAAKSGAGGGPKCADLDLASDRQAYQPAFNLMPDCLSSIAQASMCLSDRRIFAPLVAGNTPVGGYLLFGDGTFRRQT